MLLLFGQLRVKSIVSDDALGRTCGYHGLIAAIMGYLEVIVRNKRVLSAPRQNSTRAHPRFAGSTDIERQTV